MQKSSAVGLFLGCEKSQLALREFGIDSTFGIVAIVVGPLSLLPLRSVKIGSS